MPGARRPFDEFPDSFKVIFLALKELGKRKRQAAEAACR
jgi:hypothetical protein